MIALFDTIFARSVPIMLYRCDAVVTPGGERDFCFGQEIPTVENLEHAPHHPSVHGADDGMLDGGPAERAVLGDDAKFPAVPLRMGGEAVRRHGIRHGVE